MADEERFERNERLFGAEGQKKIRAAHVAIAGVGGLGLHVVQQAAFLGVGKISAIEPEELSETNRNRYIGSLAKDPIPGMPKVDIAARLVEGIDHAIEVRRIQARFPSAEALNAIRDADYVFGCFDHDGPRFVLNETCLAYEKPLFDLASDVPANDAYGGRVTIVWGVGGCLYCRGVLDPRDVRHYVSPEEALENEDAVYGVPRRHLGETGPSVVSINGVIASLAMTEFMATVTGMREHNRHLEYRGHVGTVSRRTDDPSADCYYCRTVRGLGDAAQIDRYFRREGMETCESGRLPSDLLGEC